MSKLIEQELEALIGKELDRRHRKKPDNFYLVDFIWEAKRLVAAANPSDRNRLKEKVNRIHPVFPNTCL